MTKEEIDAFCVKCDHERKRGECLLESVCKKCKDFYECVKFCIEEKKEEMKNDELRKNQSNVC